MRVTTDGPHLVATVRDLGSTNGTFVNGERVSSRRLEEGDRVTIGRTTVVYHAGRS
ncbi:MAG: FHA domain-containing protein [Intrasporangiaceae bacterium]|nr:FHA domain-containing protein [Intrasporangiaceae bacterium]